MSLYSVSFASKTPEQGNFYIKPEAHTLYFNNKECALDIAKLIVKIYTTYDVAVNVSPINISNVKIESGLSKEVLDKIFSIRVASPRFLHNPVSTSIPDFTTESRSKLEGDGAVFYFENEPLKVLQITSQGKCDTKFYLNSKSVQLTAEILKTILAKSSNTNLNDVNIKVLSYKTPCTCFRKQAGGGAYFENESIKVPIFNQISLKELQRLANSII